MECPCCGYEIAGVDAVIHRHIKTEEVLAGWLDGLMDVTISKDRMAAHVEHLAHMSVEGLIAEAARVGNKPKGGDDVEEV
jgi:hypothetical protein